MESADRCGGVEGHASYSMVSPALCQEVRTEWHQEPRKGRSKFGAYGGLIIRRATAKGSKRMPNRWKPVSSLAHTYLHF